MTSLGMSALFVEGVFDSTLGSDTSARPGLSFFE